jgi:hypothetical protein
MTLKGLLTITWSWLMKSLELVQRFWQNSLAGYLIDSRNPKDALVYIKYWALTWKTILGLFFKLLLKRGPIGLIRILIHYPWILILIGVNGLSRRLVKGRSGAYHEAICMMVHTVVVSVAVQIENIIFHSERLIINEDLVPSDIARAMGLKVWLLESMGMLLPILLPEAALKYIDEAENEGINPDACSLPKATVGMVLKAHMPEGLALVSSNMPCDAGAGSYAFIQSAYNIPTYRLDVPCGPTIVLTSIALFLLSLTISRWRPKESLSPMRP